MPKCTVCGGSGKYLSLQKNRLGQRVAKPCAICNGTGCLPDAIPIGSSTTPARRDAPPSNEKRIEVEANTLDKAREDLRHQVPSGMALLREEVLSDGAFESVHSVGDTIEDALAKARAQIPEGAVYARHIVTQHPTVTSVQVDSYNEQDVEEAVFSRYGFKQEIASIRLDRIGSSGFLGLGRRPHRFVVSLKRPAEVNLYFHRKARLRATFVPIDALKEIISPSEIQSLLDSRDPLSVPKLAAALDKGLSFETNKGIVETLLRLGWAPSTSQQRALCAVLRWDLDAAEREGIACIGPLMECFKKASWGLSQWTLGMSPGQVSSPELQRVSTVAAM